MREISYDHYYWQNELVRLRAARTEDWEANYAARYDSAARLLLQYEVELPPTESACREAAERFAGFNTESGRLMFAIESLEGELVGALNLSSINERNGTFHIGIQVLPGHRGKGSGTAAMRILLGYAFFERRLNKFHVNCLDTNTASIAMMKKLGCVQEGIQRQEVYTGGRYHDIVLFGLTRENFVEHEKAAPCCGRGRMSSNGRDG